MTDHRFDHDRSEELGEILGLAADAAFAARVAAVLRTHEPVPEGIAQRVMHAITSTPIRAEQGRPWWVRPRSVAVSPLGGLAIAASFAGFIVLGTLGLSGRLPFGAPSAHEDVAAVPAPADTVHLVRFVFVDPTATQVALVGDFNGWASDATKLAAAGSSGVWSVTLPLTPGRYEYSFVVNGKQWVADPSSQRVTDEFGAETSVLRLGGKTERAL